MKKSILVSIIFAVAAATFAVDFGGFFANFSKFADQNADDGLKLDQKDSVSLWLSTPFGSSTTDYFIMQGTYLFEHDFGADNTIQYVNLDLLKAVYVEDEFTITAGRFPLSDLSGLVYAQASDGVSIAFDIPGFSAVAYGFYTGFLNSQAVTIVDPDYSADTDKFYDLCPKYIFTGLKASLPSFLGEQAVSAEGIFSTKVSGKAFTRIYAEASIFGPLFDELYYDVTGVLCFDKYSSGGFDMGNLSSANVFYYLPVELESSVKLSAVYASGDQGPFKNFCGFSSMTAVNSLSEPEYTGLFKIGLSATVKPVSNLLVVAGTDLVFDAESSVDYAGFQYNAGVDWQIFSDVLAGAYLTQYFDSDDSSNDKTSITIKAIISF